MVDSWTSFNLNYLKFHQNEKKYYQNNHQYNVRNITYGANATPITSQQDPLQTLLIFILLGWGFLCLKILIARSTLNFRNPLRPIMLVFRLLK